MVTAEATPSLTAEGRYGAEHVAEFREKGWWRDGSAAALLDHWAEATPDRCFVSDGKSMVLCLIAAPSFEAFEVLVAERGGTISYSGAEGEGSLAMLDGEAEVRRGLRQVHLGLPLDLDRSHDASR